MSQYTPKERAEIVAFYIENNRSIVKTVPGIRCVEKWRFGVASSFSGFNSTGFFLWGYLKSKVYAKSQRQLTNLNVTYEPK